MNNLLHKTSLLTFLFLSVTLIGIAQQTSVKGKITDSETGEGMPFVNVYFTGTTIGTTSDFDGYFTLSTTEVIDSLTASYISYQPRTKAIKVGEDQTINFQLNPETTTLQEVTVVYGEYENPAWEVLRNVVKNKKKNDKRKLDAYQHESYTKIEVDVDNITDKFKQKKVVQKVIQLVDSIEHIAGEDGKPILPIFISETLSDVYYIKNPSRTRENILKTKVTGLGISDGSTVSQVIGASFQEYNFYKNWMRIVEKDFISPIADSWKLFYDYELVEEQVMVEGIPCYRIEFTPKRPQDLAFTGSMWVADSTNSYALKQIDVKVGKSANLNFIEKIKVQQQYTPVEEEGAWLPNKTRVLIDIGEVRNDWAGMLAKFYVSNDKFVINQPRPLKYFDQEVVVEEEALINNGEDYWNEHRHDSLTATEKNVYHMIDTIKSIPTIKTYIEIANIAFYGYKNLGKIDVGPYSYAYAFNEVEGHRFRLGFKTNENFSRKFIFRGYGAYGTKDQTFKYNMTAEYIPSRRPWTTMGISRTFDLEQVGIYNDDFDNSVLFNAANRFGVMRRPFQHTMNKAWFQTEPLAGIRTSFVFRNRAFNPQYLFQYLDENSGADPVRRDKFSVSELGVELRIAIREQFLQDGNLRTSLGTGNRPILKLRYTRGLDNFWNGDFSYEKFYASIDHSFRLGTFGRTSYLLEGSYTPSTLPYPMLETHLGNQSAFYNENSYNLMDFFEFVSDKYTSLRFQHRFEGVLMNRVPLFRKLKWRLFTTANVLYGSTRQENVDIIPTQDEFGTLIPGFNTLGDKPYVEVGYGIENIFKFIRVDFIHRLTYLDNGANNFGVLFSTQFRL